MSQALQGIVLAMVSDLKMPIQEMRDAVQVISQEPFIEIDEHSPAVKKYQKLI